MLFTSDETKFSIIEIQPARHNLLEHEIAPDYVVEITNPLHNYIRRNKLKINFEDIVGELTIIPTAFDKLRSEEEMKAKGLIKSVS